MATIGLSAGFSLIPEGKTIFKIEKCEYKPKFHKIEVTLKTKNGQSHTERYDISKQGGLNAFSYMAKTALHDFDLTEIDHTSIVGKFIGAEVEHTNQPHRDDPNKTVTFANLKSKFEAWGFDGETEETIGNEAPAQTSAPASKGKYDMSFLDD